MLIEKLNIDSNDFFGKTIIITGGGGGIAAETGKALAYLGGKCGFSGIRLTKGYSC